jgi:exoribonuclease-2
MIAPGSLVVYKNKPALAAESGEKITISLPSGDSLKVREKDVELIFAAPAGKTAKPACSLAEIESGGYEGADVRGAWELLRSDGENAVPFKELAELAFGEWTAKSAWAAWKLLAEGIYFSGDAAAVKARSEEEVAAAEEKKHGKEKEAKEREEFLERLRKSLVSGGEKADLAADSRFLQDVEALAWGKSEKSRTLKDLGWSETPEEAHRLLLECGAWTVWVNPYPARFNLNLNPAPFVNTGGAPTADLAAADPARVDLSRLDAFAIDSPWSTDPDDAISFEEGPEGPVLYVHVADPACAVPHGSPLDAEARARGATAYLPEVCSRMLPEELLPVFALGLGKSSPALTFKISLSAGGPVETGGFSIAKTEIFPSIVKVTRLSYEQADALAAEADTEEAASLSRLFSLALGSRERRLANGAVIIEMPEVHISVGLEGPQAGRISLSPIRPYRSAETVRECMLLAGEGAALWAESKRLPFPYITQEAGDLPAKPMPGLAGSYQLRRCMRPRVVSVKPGYHWGLGLDNYTQVTSPLRRYTDLLAHQQIRAFLSAGSGAPGTPVLDADEVLLALAAADAAAQAVTQAERASKNHWLAVYLADQKKAGEERVFEGVVVDKKGNYLVIVIPELGLETQVPAKKGLELNDTVKLVQGKGESRPGLKEPGVVGFFQVA